MGNQQDKDHLNIAMIGHKLIPSRDGGVEVVVGELSTRLVALGHQVTCYNRKGQYLGGESDKRTEPKTWEGIRLRYMPTLRQKGFAAFTASFFGAFCCAFGKYDVVHFHAEGPSAMCWLPRLFGKRVVVTIHGLDYQRAKWGWFARWFLHLGEKAAAHWADEIIVLSRSVQQYFLEEYGRQTCYIPNGITRPVQQKAQNICSEFGLTKDSYFLFVGRLVPEKGVKYLVEAFREVKTDRRLVIAGAGTDTARFTNELKKAAAEDPRILFTGFVENDILAELYSNAYVYVLPSDLEGMPLSLLEAMSYGNCCLVSDIRECVEVVEDRALTFRKGETKDLFNQMQHLCDHPEVVESLRAGAADFVCGKYQWDDVVQRTLDLYRGKVDPAETTAAVQVKKKILFFVEAMGGGVFTYVVDLSNELVNTYDVYVAYAVRNQTPENYNDYFDKRVHLIHVDNFKRSINPMKDILAVFEVRKIAKEVQPDIIHLHSSKAGVVGRIAFSGRKIPLFYTPHGYSFLMENHGPVKRALYRCIEYGCALRHCTTISCSKGEHQETLELTENAFFVNNGINLKEIDEILRGENRAADSAGKENAAGSSTAADTADKEDAAAGSAVVNRQPPRSRDYSGYFPRRERTYSVFTLGRICYQKNPGLFNRIAQRLPDVRFVWIGDGDLRNELTAPNIEVTGWLEREKALRIANKKDIFLLPSRWEGLPMSLLESMYLRKLCIVSNVIGNRDVIDNGVNGFICETVDDYVAAIRKGMDPGRTDTQIENAYQDVCSQYSKTRMAQEYSKIYMAELNRRGRGE